MTFGDRERARARLLEGGYTAVLCKGDSVVTSTARGVAPLLAWLDEGAAYGGYSAADKVVGRGAAFLYVLLGVSAVHAEIISESARTVLEKARIPCTYTALVPRIRNRTGDGFCPIETAVASLENPAEALAVIRKTLRELSESSAKKAP